MPGLSLCRFAWASSLFKAWNPLSGRWPCWGCSLQARWVSHSRFLFGFGCFQILPCSGGTRLRSPVKSERTDQRPYPGIGGKPIPVPDHASLRDFTQHAGHVCRASPFDCRCVQPALCVSRDQSVSIVGLSVGGVASLSESVHCCYFERASKRRVIHRLHSVLTDFSSPSAA